MLSSFAKRRICVLPSRHKSQQKPQMKLLKTFGETKPRATAVIQQLEQRGAVNTARVDTTVRTILADVRERGDSALRELATRFDNLEPDQPLRVTPEEMRAAWDATSEPLKAALRLAQANIRLFAERQLPKAWSFRPLDGMELGQII